MKFTIIPDDNNFGVDGEWREIDLSALVGTVHAVQFDTVKGKGEVERGASGNEAITSFAQFQGYYAAWVAAAPPPVPLPTPAEYEATRITSIKSEAGKLILARYPQYKQNNMLRETTHGAAWAWIDAVRQASNDAEAMAGKQVVDIVWP